MQKKQKHTRTTPLISEIKISEPLTKRQLQSREEDLQLIKNAIKGNQKAFFLLRTKYYNLIYKCINQLIKDTEEIEDLTQETSIKAFSSLSSFNKEFAFSTWLFKIARNNTIDFLRKKKLHTFSIDKPIESDDSDYSFELPDNELNPNQKLIATQKMFNDALYSLPTI